jgi:hypothetical protein
MIKKDFFKKYWCYAIILILIISSLMINQKTVASSRYYDITPITKALAPIDDAYIANNSVNYGTSTDLRIRNNYGGGGSPGWYCDTLIKFDLSSVPTGSTIISATLKLYYYTYWNNNPAGRNLNLYSIICPWDEHTVTGYSKPWHATLRTSYSTVPSSFGWMNWNVKNDVQDFIDGCVTNFGWRITDENYWGQVNIPFIAFYSKEKGSYTPVLEVKYSQVYDNYYCNGFSVNPNLQGNNYNSYAMANWDSTNQHIDWVGRRDTQQIDRYFTFSGVYINQPMFSCVFWADSYTDAGQKWGLINHFYLKKTDGKYIGFGHTMDSDDVGIGHRGIRGEFYNGVNTYYTPWILINDETTYTIKVYIEGGVGKISQGNTVNSVSLSGNFLGVYNSFHLQLGGVPSADDNNGASGWFDNLALQYPKFTIPRWGGAMIHSDPHESDFINLPVPITNVDQAWLNMNEWSEKTGCIGNGIAGNSKIAACPFGYFGIHGGPLNNLIIYDYNGNILWKSLGLLTACVESSTPMVDKYNRVVACDDLSMILVDLNFNKDGEYVWRTNILTIVPPLSPTITDNGVIVLPTLCGFTYSFDIEDGSLLDIMNFGLYSSKNSACVNGNRVYLIVSKVSFDSQLCAIDVDSDGNLNVAWSFPFQGKSQATPTFIDGTLYFDVYQSGDTYPQVYAVSDRGTYYHLEWIANCDHLTLFSMSCDPRGGIWYEDHTGRRVIRLDTNNGEILDNISIDELINEYSQSPPYERKEFIPMSVMEICGNEGNLIMIISANNHTFFPLFVKNYVIAIDLSDNSLLWKYVIEDQDPYNYAGGQYTILTDDTGGNPRIVFIKYFGGVMAIKGSTS